MTRLSQTSWSLDNLNRLDGQTALITGSTGGLGFEIACGLAERGASIILSGRNLEKGRAALNRLYERVPSVQGRFEVLDLASLASISAFATALREQGRPIQLLANNAGIMGPASRLTTKDGFELQFGHQPPWSFCSDRTAAPSVSRRQCDNHDCRVPCCPEG